MSSGSSSAPDLPVTVLDRIVLPDAQPGETQDEHEEPGDPLPLCDHLLPSEERLGLSALEALSPGEAKQGPRTIDMRTSRFEQFIVIIWEAIRASIAMVKEVPVLRQPV
jgi:hypothetical protein